GIPPIATRLGSFADAVQDGVNGFLADPAPEAILARLREVNSNRALLQPVRNRLNARTPRMPADMIADYERLLRAPGLSGRAYFALKGGLPRHSVVTRGFQVLWSTRGNGFSEDASRRKDIRITGATQRVEIKLPAMDSPPTQIRVDLGDQPGFMRLLRVELLSSAGNRVWG